MPPTLREDLRRDVTVVIPTICSQARAEGLVRAVESLCRQTAGVPSILVVANGPQVCTGLLDDLVRRYGVTARVIAEGNLPRAMREGRMEVATPFFGFLDDDDEYLPPALAMRLAALRENANAAAAVTDGYYVENGREEPRGVATLEAAKDPLRALPVRNWLASCGGLFRSELVTTEFFDGVTRYLEWTVIAYKIALRYPVVLLPAPGYRIHSLPESLSKSDAYLDALPFVLGAIAGLALPVDVRNAVLRRRGEAYHSISSRSLRERRLGEAWRAHLRSLGAPGGTRYLTYTARLLLGARRADPERSRRANGVGGE
jgi:hypothetical protein